jgi:signal transduction histidine kinase
MWAMHDGEKRLLNQRIRHVATLSARSTTAVIISSLLAALTILGIFFMLKKEHLARLNFERQLIRFQSDLRDKVEKLHASNKELEQFAYVASHDLQEPLRKIITFNDRLHHKFAEQITPEMLDYMQRISNAASRMRVLIDNLLLYSRATRNEVAFAPVNLAHVFGIIRDNYEVTINHRNVQFVQHGQFPEVEGDKTQLVQLFQNIVSNAIKFTPASATPVIDISCSITTKEELASELVPPAYAQYHRISVLDHGIGFAQEEAEKIFVIFHRLHGRSEYEGTGIGLSISKKIAENHQGYIHARSEPGKGAEFVVYLPKK